MVARSTRYLIVLLASAFAGAQSFQTLEQAASRSGSDLTAAYEGRPVSIRAQVSTLPIWAVGMYYLPVRDLTDHGLILRGDREQFAELVPGDWIEARGIVQSRGGMPLLAPTSLTKLRHDPAPEPKNL